MAMNDYLIEKYKQCEEPIDANESRLFEMCRSIAKTPNGKRRAILGYGFFSHDRMRGESKRLAQLVELKFMEKINE